MRRSPSTRHYVAGGVLGAIVISILIPLIAIRTSTKVVAVTWASDAVDVHLQWDPSAARIVLPLLWIGVPLGTYLLFRALRRRTPPPALSAGGAAVTVVLAAIVAAALPVAVYRTESRIPSATRVAYTLIERGAEVDAELHNPRYVGKRLIEPVTITFMVPDADSCQVSLYDPLPVVDDRLVLTPLCFGQRIVFDPPILPPPITRPSDG